MWVTKRIMVPTDFRSIFIHSREVINCLVTNILQNIFHQKKETHPGLEQLEGEQKATEFLFLGGLSLSGLAG